MKNLHTILIKAVPRISDKLTHINWGGCGLFAHQLSKTLASKGIPSDIVLVRWSWYTAGDIKDMLRRHNTDDINAVYREHFSHGKSGFDACIGHIAVRVDGKLYDSEGVHPNFQAISDAIEPDVMELLIKNGSWNPEFLGDNSCTQAQAVDTMATFLGGVLSEVAA